MKVTTITVQKVKTLGDYQSERLEMTALLDEGEDPDAAALTLRLKVKSLLNQSLPMTTMTNADSLNAF
ncbi:hypothetical protein [Kamptonema formosum]|uniref:hypothetical protein n=1 Tax=Kamptonema formosum TaxID=331992 RepID=UPI000347502F|nr:hypothetical protein [Kamptonema formosum]